MERHLPRLRPARHGPFVAGERLVECGESLGDLLLVTAPGGIDQQLLQRHRRIAVAVRRAQRLTEVFAFGGLVPFAETVRQLLVSLRQMIRPRTEPRVDVPGQKRRDGTPDMRDAHLPDILRRNGGEHGGSRFAQPLHEDCIWLGTTFELGGEPAHKRGRIGCLIEVEADGMANFRTVAQVGVEPAMGE